MSGMTSDNSTRIHGRFVSALIPKGTSSRSLMKLTAPTPASSTKLSANSCQEQP